MIFSALIPDLHISLCVFTYECIRIFYGFDILKLSFYLSGPYSYELVELAVGLFYPALGRFKYGFELVEFGLYGSKYVLYLT